MAQLETIQQHFRTLRMPTAVQVVEETIASAQKENWSLEAFLADLLEQEMEGRRLRRIERLKKSAHLPVEKTLASFDQKRLPLRLRRLLPQLCTGSSSIAPRIYWSLVCPGEERHISPQLLAMNW